MEAEGATVRQVIDNLDRAWPGIRDRLLEEGRLRPNISVAVDGEVSPTGLLEPVAPVERNSLRGGHPGRLVLAPGGCTAHCCTNGANPVVLSPGIRASTGMQI